MNCTRSSRGIWFLILIAAFGAAQPAWSQEGQKRKARPAFNPESLGETPQWIWLAMPADNQPAYFRRDVLISSQPTSVRLYATADDQLSVFVDGKPAFEHENWQVAVVRDLTPMFLTPDNPQGLGKHVIAIQAKNGAGPAGLVARLVIESPQSLYVLTTGPSWKVSYTVPEGWQATGFDDSKWLAATSWGKLGDKPRDGVTEATFASAAEILDPVATPVDQLKVAKGFRVELLYSVPKPLEGSWVNLCVDPKGRLIVSDQYGGLYRVTVPPPVGAPIAPVPVPVPVPGRPPVSTGPETIVEKIPVALGEAQGLLWAFDSLYVVVNKGQTYDSGLYRVRDTNGDDQLDQVELLKKIDGGGEHGPHAVLLSPDGKSLHIVCGNGTKMMDVARSRVPRFWGEDHLLPRMPDGKGFMKDVLGPGGCIYKVDPEGKEWELVATGFRNEYDAAFNRDGDLFSYDADMEWDVNTPWYRPTRVCLVTSGAEFGWRNGAGKWPAYSADSLPAVVNVGPGSPTGICFGYGAKFPFHYQEALFICDWSYGKLYAVHLSPKGAAYTGEIEEFVTGTPLPLTDVVVNPHDGAMYFAIGGRKVQSGLYRVTFLGPPVAGPPTPPAPEERQTRRMLESLHERKDAAAIDQIWPHLGSEDRFVRYAARVALEHQDPAAWKDRALQEPNPPAAVTAILALVRVNASCPFHRAKDAPPVDAELKAAILKKLLSLDWASMTYGPHLELLRTYHVFFNRFGPPEGELREQVVSRFDGLFPAAGRELNVEIANLMIYLEAPSAASKTMALFEASPTQEEQIDYARALRVLKSGWTPELRKAYFSWFLKAGNFRGGASFELFVKGIKKDALATLSDEEKVVLKEILEATPTLNTPVVGPPRPVVKEWKLDELVPLVENGMSGRDFDRGRQLFAAANCFACHRFDNEGGANGPDLSGIAGRFDRRDLLETIVEPSKVISDQYAAVNVETLDGKVYTGRIVNLNSDTIFVNTNMLNPDEQSKIDRRYVVEMVTSKVSMMPDGLLNTLKEDEVLDLMAYLLSRGDRNHEMFKK